MHPTLGSIACWKVGKLKDGSDGAGHVAVVEEIKSNGDIVTSNSAWGGKEFYMQTFSKLKDYGWKGKTGKKYELIGFIIPSIHIIETPKIHTITGSVNLRIGPGVNFPAKKVLHRGDKFVGDGEYSTFSGNKWYKGICNGLEGWVSSKYMR